MYIITQIISDCTELPTDLENIIIVGDQFPVPVGTVVSLSCVTGYSLYRGDDKITCQGGDQFTWNTAPECKQGKCILIDNLISIN